jgi:hypothetical protein
MSQTRRVFLTSTASASLAATAAAQSPNDRIACAVIGVRGRGQSFWGPLAARQDTTVAALCDIDTSALGGAAAAVMRSQNRAPRTFEDFRRVLDDRAIDAVFICTPHHWHCPNGPSRRLTARAATPARPIRQRGWASRRR